MQALLVIDVQEGLVGLGDFTQEVAAIERLIQDFRTNHQPIIFIKHLDDIEESTLYEGGKGIEIYQPLQKYVEIIIEKRTPSAFFKTELAELLDQLKVDHLFITGFNTEFCCQFTAISAFDRGYKVTFIEGATATANNDQTYEMPGLHINEFVSTVLHWSNVIEVLDMDEYEECYKII